MKRITKYMPKRHIMLGSLVRNQFFNFKSVKDDVLIIWFLDKIIWLNFKLIKEAKATMCYLQYLYFLELNGIPN
ncbi:hypothetical protein BZG02_13780 [Labilibaculum filiforme]|uniref:Uncharacterized protein n=1 Tax=Labilibaculum filiforme TaxID=1940526 RepID=A0A2N3HVA4_9BACT|nr:hypothetical protein [Labilibaculum filiforme]PKQ62005.1 hypothetical protein BZG02_13780 [Labilibaculum filiforme]